MPDPRHPVLIVTRPAPAAESFAAEAVVGFGARAVVSPVMRIVQVDPGALPGGLRGLVFSSAHGVARARELGLSGGLPAHCVGPRTAAAARKAGFAAEEVGATADALVEGLAARRLPGPLLHLHGAHSRGNVAARLRKAGTSCEERVVYDQVAVPLSETALTAFSGDAPVVLPLFSPRSVLLLSDQARPGAERHVVAISEEVARAAAALHPATLHRADRPDGDAMLRATRDVLGWLESREVAG